MKDAVDNAENKKMMSRVAHRYQPPLLTFPIQITKQLGVRKCKYGKKHLLRTNYRNPKMSRGTVASMKVMVAFSMVGG